MDTHIITIGDEILTGQTLNTNAGYIGEKLADIQVNIKKATIVGDNAAENSFKISSPLSATMKKKS